MEGGNVRYAIDSLLKCSDIEMERTIIEQKVAGCKWKYINQEYCRMNCSYRIKKLREIFVYERCERECYNGKAGSNKEWIVLVNNIKRE